MSLPRGERSDSRELAKGREGGEVGCDVSRIVPHVLRREVSGMGGTAEQVVD